MRFRRLLNLAGDRLAALPLLVMYITDGCNSRCGMCDIWKHPRRNMPLALAESLASAVGELGISWVLLSGGEAMQHPQWPAIAQMFRRQGVRVMLLTNGLLLRRQTADVAAHVDELIVSLDGGTAATYEAIRGVDALNLVLEGIAACKAAGVRVTTRTTVQRLNYKEIPQIADAAMLAGADLISYLAVDTANPFAFGDRQNIADDALTSEQCAELARILDDFAVSHAQAFRAGRIAETPAKLRRILYGHFYSARHGTPYDGPLCNAPHFSTVVEVDGTLRPCYFLPAYGRLTPSESSLKAAINTDAAAALRQAYRSGQREECARCVCPLYKSPRALVNM